MAGLFFFGDKSFTNFEDFLQATKEYYETQATAKYVDEMCQKMAIEIWLNIVGTGELVSNGQLSRIMQNAMFDIVCTVRKLPDNRWKHQPEQKTDCQ